MADDSDYQVILALGLSNHAPDVWHPEPMLQRFATTAVVLPDVMTADVGYRSENNAKNSTAQGIDVYIATGRLPHGQPLRPKHGPMPKDADVKSQMAL